MSIQEKIDKRMDFRQLYPTFALRMRVQRAMVRAALKDVASSDRWQGLLSYERRIRRDVLTEEAAVAVARRPRRFSDEDIEGEQRARRRTQSEPADIVKGLSAPKM